jgi:hypothetical protein
VTHLVENAHWRPVLIANNSAFDILKLPLALMARSAVLDFAERSRSKKIFCGERRSVELRALCNDSPRTPPGPEGSNGNGSASCAAEYPKFLSSHPEPDRAAGKVGLWAAIR